MAPTCGTCWRKFPAGFHSRNQHFDATGHNAPKYECDTCERYFSSQPAVRQHMNATNHWNKPSYECKDCYDNFDSKEDREEHEVDEHLYCRPCERYFMNSNNMRAHRNSKTHRSGSLECPFCKGSHGTATGLMHHLERGACLNAPLNKRLLYEAVRRRDPNGILTKNLLTWSGMESTYEATEMAYNYSTGSYQCYLCQRCFQSLSSLNQHLQSPVHEESLYRCPNRACPKEFTTLAGLINHLESESCSFMRFDAVQRKAQQILDPGRMISF